jgi:ribosome recycling factor
MKNLRVGAGNALALPSLSVACSHYNGSIAMADDIFSDTERRMQKAIEALRHDLAVVRTGRASAALLERIQIDYYGVPTPINGQVIRLNIPPLNEERRREMVKTVHKKLDEHKVAIRNVRRDCQEKLRDREKKKEISEDELKRSTERLQKLTDRFIDEMDKVGKTKELDILEV